MHHTCKILTSFSYIYIYRDIYTAVRESSAQEVELGDDGSWRPVQSKLL